MEELLEVIGKIFIYALGPEDNPRAFIAIVLLSVVFVTIVGTVIVIANGNDVGVPSLCLIGVIDCFLVLVSVWLLSCRSQ